MKNCCEMTRGDITASGGKTLKGSFKKKIKQTAFTWLVFLHLLI
jgi:hypothetical protein